MLIVARVLAQLVDIFTSLGVLVFLALVVHPAITDFGIQPTIGAVFVLILAIAIIAGIQYVFLQTHQTIGKAFFRLKIVSTEPDRPLDMSILLQREAFIKMFSCYLVCFPVLLGRVGGHEVATKTKVDWSKNIKTAQEENDA